MTATLAPSNVSVRVVLSDKVADTYQKQADERGIALEMLLAERLSACATHTAQNPLYFNDTQRREIEEVCKANIPNAPWFMNFVRRYFQVSLNGIKLQLSPAVVERLRTRQQGHDEFGKWLEGLVNRLLAEWVGL